MLSCIRLHKIIKCWKAVISVFSEYSNKSKNLSTDWTVDFADGFTPQNYIILARWAWHVLFLFWKHNKLCFSIKWPRIFSRVVNRLTEPNINVVSVTSTCSWIWEARWTQVNWLNNCAKTNCEESCSPVSDPHTAQVKLLFHRVRECRTRHGQKSQSEQGVPPPADDGSPRLASTTKWSYRRSVFGCSSRLPPSLQTWIRR